MFDEDLKDKARAVLQAARDRKIRIATVETCTAGLLSACLTSVAGASETFERGFILYHASAKATGIGVDETISRKFGAVSAEVTSALADAGLKQSTAGLASAITGYAGPGGGNEHDPVGTVYIAVSGADNPTSVTRHVIAGDRETVRLHAVALALTSMEQFVA